MIIRRVLLVCTGNTCRSPMAAAILGHKWKESGSGWNLEVSSAGTGALGGQPASEHAVTAMSGRGIDLTGHRSQLVGGSQVENADLILTMTRRHKDYVLQIWPSLNGRVYTLGEYAGDFRDITDPFGGTLEDYETTAKDLDSVLQAVVDRIRKEGTAGDEGGNRV